MRKHVIFRTMICVSSRFAVARGGNPQAVSSCAGLRENDLSSTTLVALTKAERQAIERVEGNDQNGKSRDAGGG